MWKTLRQVPSGSRLGDLHLGLVLGHDEEVAEAGQPLIGPALLRGVVDQRSGREHLDHEHRVVDQRLRAVAGRAADEHVRVDPAPIGQADLEIRPHPAGSATQPLPQERCDVDRNAGMAVRAAGHKGGLVPEELVALRLGFLPGEPLLAGPPVRRRVRGLGHGLIPMDQGVKGSVSARRRRGGAIPP